METISNGRKSKKNIDVVILGICTGPGIVEVKELEKEMQLKKSVFMIESSTKMKS